ncbi:MAG: Mannosyltransferase B-like protein [Parcubacteria group bacterium Gr01-1014_38]|nr:MAG: Mannosyltransferase B-like protein [Parcubacteria group bacterium Gr01-1014_38]
MRIGFDAHILAPEHHKYHPEIAAYTRELLRRLVAANQGDTFVVFLDARTPPSEVTEFAGRPNVEIRHFPFTQYRAYLPFFYSHMLVSAFLSAAKLDVFHSPEGLIPYLYPGNIIATFHWVPLGERGTNVFLKTWMLGARVGFKALCRKAGRILLRREGDKKLLCDVHGYPEAQAVVVHCEDLGEVDWKKHTADVLAVYRDVVEESKKGWLSRLPRPRLPRLRRKPRPQAAK